MFNRRKNTRYPVSIQFRISNLYKENGEKIDDLDTPIEFEDISQNGLCFKSEGVFPVDYCFDSLIDFEDDKIPPIPVTIQIIDVVVVGRNYYRYGCKFIGVSAQLQFYIEQYFSA